MFKARPDKADAAAAILSRCLLCGGNSVFSLYDNCQPICTFMLVANIDCVDVSVLLRDRRQTERTKNDHLSQWQVVVSAYTAKIYGT